MYEDINRVIDKYFNFMKELDGFHYIPEFIPKSMQDNTPPSRFEDTLRWKVISSTVTDKQIQEYEIQIGLKLPNSYKYFLKYKNFIEMVLGEYPIVFFKNLPTDWLTMILEQQHPYNEHLTGRGLIPFASYSDYGVVCFDTKDSVGEDLEYPIVWLDHDDGYTQENELERNFLQLIRSCEPHLDNWIKDKRKA